MTSGLAEQARAWARAFVSRPPLRGAARVITLVLAIALITAVTVVDATTRPNLALSAFYILPVAVGTITVGANAGLTLAVGSAVMWLIADLVRGPPPTAVLDVVNCLLRTVIFLTVVIPLAALREALTDARVSEQRGRRFLDMAAHQLRTPVAGVRSAADALLAAGASPQQERLLKHITEESARSGRLISSLLRVARLDQGERLRLQDCDLADVARAEAARISERSPRLHVDVHVDPSLPQRLALSTDAMREALANILENARRHAVERVRVDLCVERGNAVIRVSDDGPGVPAGAEDRIFERFVSLDGLGGSGLGLPIARGLIEYQHGSLSLEDRAFVVRLPITLSSADQGAPSTRSV